MLTHVETDMCSAPLDGQSTGMELAALFPGFRLCGRQEWATLCRSEPRLVASRAVPEVSELGRAQASQMGGQGRRASRGDTAL